MSVRDLQQEKIFFGYQDFNTTVCVGSRIPHNQKPNPHLNFNTTVCVGSSLLYLFVFPVVGYFNTTVCVGSRLNIPIHIISSSLFQYNCLCRFESSAFSLASFGLTFQYNCLCRFEYYLVDYKVFENEFQYNCLCRFETKWY